MEQVKECMKVTIEYMVRTRGPTGQEGESPNETCSFIYGVDVQYPSVEKALAGIDITMPLAIEVIGQVNCCFRSLSVYMCCSHIRHAPLQNS